MLIGLVFSLLTATFTVSSRDQAVVSGTVPKESTYTYTTTATTGSKGQMTADNTITLSLDGWNGCVLRKVSLSMHSNTKAGSGWLDMRVGTNQVWSIADADFASPNWNGAFTSAWSEIAHTLQVMVPDSQRVVIQVGASKNSLYIEKIVISYEPVPKKAHTVDFYAGGGRQTASLTEISSGAGILLPEGNDTLGWHFVGWTDTDFEIAQPQTPDVCLIPGDRYYPEQDISLYALYEMGKEPSWVTTPLSGVYAVVIRVLGDWYALQGSVQDGVIDMFSVDVDSVEGEYVLLSDIQSDALYNIDFCSDKSLTLSHFLSGQDIGHNANNRLAALKNEFDYVFWEDGQLSVSYVKSSKYYYLWPGFGYDMEKDHYCMMIELLTPGTINIGWFLFDMGEMYYTTQPWHVEQAVEGVKEMPKSAVEVQIGTWNMQIIDGKKYIRLCM